MNTEALTSLPFESRVRLHAVLSETIERVLNKVEGDNDGSKINRTEKSLTRTLVKVHNDTATRANRRAIKTFNTKSEKPFTKTDMNRLVRSLSNSFTGMENKTVKRVETDFDNIYKTAKVRFSRQNNVIAKRKIKKANELAQGVSFDIIDEATIAKLSELSSVAIGDHFPANLKPRVTNSITKNVLEKGMNKAQAGEFLKKELTRINGGNAFSSTPASIQAQGLKSVNAYYEGLSATNVTLARNFANVQHMVDAGILRVQFDAIIDNRTSQICSQMDGRIFTIEQVTAFRDQYLEADSVEAVKGFATWHKNVGSIPGNSKGLDISSADLASAGVIVPPLHFRCRSELSLA